MLNKQLLNPNSIVVVGASNDVQKPGGKILKNIVQGNYNGDIYAVNPKENNVQNVRTFQSVADLPAVELAIIAVSCQFVIPIVKELTQNKNTKAFIIISAGFSEVGEEGKKIEQEIVDIIKNANGCLIGPNCIGVMTPNYCGVFTEPLPQLSSTGCDFVSGSGATACFIMEAAIPLGLQFANVFSVGNSAMLGVEDILQYMDENFNPDVDSKIKLLYLEKVDRPDLLLKHASSLIQKGCKIAAIKAGASEEGSRAASSHTGALASSDLAVDVLFKRAGIVRCYSREELVNVACVFNHKESQGKNFAIITHAGGPAVMLTDALAKNNLKIPQLKGKKADELLTKLYHGSSVSNPIDFLATGTAEQLSTIIDYCENEFDEIDAMIVIFGNPGLFTIFDVYDVLDKKMKECKKPIYPVLPSIITAKSEIEKFVAKPRVYFPDEVVLGNALAKVINSNKPIFTDINKINILKNIEKSKKEIRNIVENCKDGYISNLDIVKLLDSVEIPRVKELVINSENEAINYAKQIGYPLVAKVVGPLHKSDVGGVIVGIKNEEELIIAFDNLMKIKDAKAVLLQELASGMELFVGAKKEDKFGHILMCGMGGIFIEVLKDTASALCPIDVAQAKEMIKSLKSYKILQGIRGKDGINENIFAEIISKVSLLLHFAPEITEMDLNPLLASKDKIIAVDARIRISF